MTPTEEFLASIEAYLAEHQMAPRAFGVAALNDPNFVFDLRANRSPSLKLVERVQQYMATHSNARRDAVA